MSKKAAATKMSMIGVLDGGSDKESVYFEIDTTDNAVNRVETFGDMSYTRKANYTQHKLHGLKAAPEFTGLEDDTVSFPVTFSAFLGVNPQQELDKLIELKNNRRLCTLITGESPQGYFYVTDVNSVHKRVSNRGETFQIDASVKLLEEPYPPGQNKPKSKETSGKRKKK